MNKIIPSIVILFMLSVPNVLAQGPCKADFDCNGGVDAGDVGTFLAEWNHRTIYNNPCPCVETSCPCSTVYVCEGTLSPLGRWCDQGDGTVKDMTTGLVWLQMASLGMLKPWEDCTTHDDAHTEASLLEDGIYGLTDGSVQGDWRLPTKNELMGIVVGDEYIRSSQMYFFKLVGAGGYWTSTAWASNPDEAWAVGMIGGGAVPDDKNNGNGVWPVRGGQ